MPIHDRLNFDAFLRPKRKTIRLTAESLVRIVQMPEGPEWPLTLMPALDHFN